LRRARSRIELASDPATMALVAGLVKRAKDGRLRDEPENYERLGIVAGVLAYVESDERTPEGRVAKAGGRAVPTFAANLAQSARSDGPAMSELRFRQLRAATDPDDLLRLWRRALHLAGRRADVASLADDLYTWLIEIENGEASPMNSARFQWAWDYYRQSRDENHSEPTPTPEVKE
jgi:CRISPR system Cascade subunit CasB